MSFLVFEDVVDDFLDYGETVFENLIWELRTSKDPFLHIF